MAKDDSNVDDFNPFRAPKSQEMGDGYSTSSDELIRNEHLSHEASIKSLGTLYFLGGVCLMLVALVGDLGNKGFDAGPFAALFFVTGLLLLVAVGLFRLKTWARWMAVVAACLGVLVPPFGTLINAYVLYLLLSAKGAMVFSPEYRKIIEATPHIKYRTSKIVVVLLVLLLVVLGLALGATFFG